MPTAIFAFRLKTGVSLDDYRRWVEQFDYPRVRQIPSVVSQRIHLMRGHVFSNGSLPYDVVEVLEFTNMDDYRNDLKTHPAAQAIAAQLPNYVDVEQMLGVYGDFVPPGVIHKDATGDQLLSDIADAVKRIAAAIS